MGQGQGEMAEGCRETFGVGGHVYYLGCGGLCFFHTCQNLPYRALLSVCYLLLVSYTSVKLFENNQCRCWVGNGFGAEEPVGVCPERWLCFGQRDDQGQQLKPALEENPEDLVMDTGGGEKLGKRVIFSFSC